MIKEEMKDLARNALKEFNQLNDRAYAFFFCLPPEGNFVYPLILSENYLSNRVQDYYQRGYRTLNNDFTNTMKISFRWHTGEDWFTANPNLSRASNREIAKAIDSGHIQLFDRQVEKLCLQALKELDNEGLFGDTNNRLVLGLTHRSESYEEMMEWIEELNPVNLANKVVIEIQQAYQIEALIIFPGK